MIPMRLGIRKNWLGIRLSRELMEKPSLGVFKEGFDEALRDMA